MAKANLIKQSIDDWLDNVDYTHLNSGLYVPSEFALLFMNFIKLVNGGEGESHKTPPVHLKMLDKLTEGTPYIVNLCFRGAAKTSLFMEYFSLFSAVFQMIPGFGSYDGMIYVSDSMDNGVKSARKNIEFRYNNSEFLQKWLPQAKFTDNYIEFRNIENKPFAIKMFGAKTGIRGTKIFGKRPVIAVLDDLISDDDARSNTSMELIKETVYSGINHALDTTRRKVIFNGTPFNKTDVIIEAVESGGWDVNVWPVCEKFPCTREEFNGAWPDRFSYDYVKEQYDLAKATGHLPSFYQELMLRISNEDERLVQQGEIRWYERTNLLKNRGYYNFYITTDFATSSKQTADYSVISVWAYNSNGDWFWVDGMCKKTTMDDTINQLFKFCAEYMPQQVGIEVTGQQSGFIQWIQSEMMTRNQFFNLASSQTNSSQPGIRPVVDKLSRFNMVVPWFRAGKIYFPIEAKNSDAMKECMTEIKLALVSGLKGKDDFLDTISMLVYLSPWQPTTADPGVDDGYSAPKRAAYEQMWDTDMDNTDVGGVMDSYVV